MYHLKNHNADRSSLAYHNIETGHRFIIDNVSLLKSSMSENLNMLEAIYMKKFSNNLMNTDLSPLNNTLLDLVTNC